jgi:hypothetical protein
MISKGKNVPIRLNQCLYQLCGRNSSLAIDIAHAIERMGFTAWYYERDTVPGRSYLLQIGEEIDACRAVILLISSHSLGSYQVTQEVIRAYESNKPFIPLLIDSSSGEIRGRIADHANKLISHFYGVRAPLSASNFPGAARYSGPTPHAPDRYRAAPVSVVTRPRA